MVVFLSFMGFVLFGLMAILVFVEAESGPDMTLATLFAAVSGLCLWGIISIGSTSGQLRESLPRLGFNGYRDVSYIDNTFLYDKKSGNKKITYECKFKAVSGKQIVTKCIQIVNPDPLIDSITSDDLRKER